jgi:hypothetical protein
LRNLARELHAANPFQELDYFARDIQRELIEKKDTTPLVHALILSELQQVGNRDDQRFAQRINVGRSNHSQTR